MERHQRVDYRQAVEVGYQREDASLEVERREVEHLGAAPLARIRRDSA